MTGIEILTAIIIDALGHVAGEEIKEALDKILHGEDFSAMVASGDPAALSLQSAFHDAGIDPNSLSGSDWAQFDTVADTQLSGLDGPDSSSIIDMGS